MVYFSISHFFNFYLHENHEVIRYKANSKILSTLYYSIRTIL